MNGDAPLLELRNLTIRYHAGERRVTAVRDVSFGLKPGGSLAIVGESGSGKTSVAGAILDFLGPEAEVSGAMLFENQDVAVLAPAQRRRMLGWRIGAVSTKARPLLIMRPQSAAGGCTPKPRKLSTAPNSTANTTRRLASTISTGQILGSSSRINK